VPVVMVCSGLCTCLFGLLSGMPWYAIVALSFVMLGLHMGDSSALTSGMVANSDPTMRGASMALHSMLGFGAGILAGAGVSLLMVLFCVRWGLDQIVVGIAITLTCEGATALIFESEFAESRPTLGATDKVAVPWLSDLPVIGGKGESNGSVFTQPLVVYLGLVLAVLVAWMLRRTHMGLNVRAAGDAPGALDAAGVSVFTTRTWAVLFAGAMAGLGGLRAEIARGIATKAVMDRLPDYDLIANTPAEFGVFLRKDAEMTARVIARSGATAD